MTQDPVRIRIQNDQSVEDVELEVSGFTCITGKTNAGKSAMMRAISGAILNQPVVGMVRKGAKFCTVEVSSSGWGFRWEKGEKGINRYTINGKVYDKVGQVQLPEVNSMGFGSIKVGDKEVQPWWSSQFSPLFLLDKSGPQVTDFISEVSRLTVLQDAIVLAARGKRGATDEAKAKSDEAAKLREKAARVAPAEQLEGLHRDLEAQAESIREYEAKLALSESLELRMSTAASKIRALSGAAAVAVPEDGLEGRVAELATMHRLWCLLEACAKRVIALKEAPKVPVPEAPDAEAARYAEASRFSGIDVLRRSVAAMEGVRAVAVPDSGPISAEAGRIAAGAAALEKIARLSESVRTLSAQVSVPDDPGLERHREGVRALERAAALQQEVSNLSRKALNLDLEFGELCRSIAAIPSCPTCARPMAAEHSHRAKSA